MHNFTIYTLHPLVTMPIDKVEWIIVDNYGQPKIEFIHV